MIHSVIERVILGASDSLDHCTQVVKFQEDYMKSLASIYLSVISALFKICVHLIGSEII